MIAASAWLFWHIHYGAMCHQPNWIGVCPVHYENRRRRR